MNENTETDWRDEAACRSVGPDVMQPDRPSSRTLSIARQVCMACPVIERCRQEAADHLAYGMWAGKWHGEQDYELRECAASRCDNTLVAAYGTEFCSEACSLFDRREKAAALTA